MSVDYSYNLLSEFPPLEESSVNSLVLRCNRFHEIAKSLPQLLSLDISDNFVSSINLSLFPELRKLDCSFNRFTELPISNSLNEVDCSGNLISRLPPDLKNIESLTARQNVIKSVDVKNAVFLEKFVLCGNPIEHIAIDCQMPRLKVLQCTHCLLKSFCVQSPELVPALERIDAAPLENENWVLKLAIEIPSVKRINNEDINDEMRRLFRADTVASDQRRLDKKVSEVFDSKRQLAQQQIHRDIKFLERVKDDILKRQLSEQIDITHEKTRIRKMLLETRSPTQRLPEEVGLPEVVRLSRMRCRGLIN